MLSLEYQPLFCKMVKDNLDNGRKPFVLTFTNKVIVNVKSQLVKDFHMEPKEVDSTCGTFDTIFCKWSPVDLKTWTIGVSTLRGTPSSRKCG